MTKLAVIHLSDIHIEGPNDPCLNKVEEIASACYFAARNSDACLISVTGDVAHSGAASEYSVATDELIRPIIDALKRETNRPVYVAIAPGNHDCILKPSDEIRETLIQAIVETPSKGENEAMVEACTKAQKDFFDFALNMMQPMPTMHSKLFWQQEFNVGTSCVRVSSLNAAWMSRLPETQGQLVYPVGRFEGQLAAPAGAHLALVHHPFNWYSQSAYQHLRKRLRLSCTVVLSGHEHQGNVGKLDEQLSGTSLFFEAPALQPHEKDIEAGFGVHLFDLDVKSVSSQLYSLTVDGVAPCGEPVIHSWTDENLVHGALDVSPDFASLLSDAGGNFSHAAKEHLTLEDIFVWPDVRDWENDEVSKRKTGSAQELLSRLKQGTQLIIYGDEKAGKTTLLFWYFRELVALGYAPVFLSASDSNVKSDGDAEKRISKAIAEQYKNSNAVRNLSRERKFLLVDDVDRLRSGPQTLPHLLNYAQRHFSSICLTAASGFEVTNLVSTAATTALSSFKGYDLTRFGYKLRHQLIRKWCSLSSVSTRPELDQRVEEVESVINVVIGKRLVPEHPIYLLILLQSCEQHRHGEIQNSGLSFYYQYLITKSLGEVGVKPVELDEHFNYLSILAWKFRSMEVKELDLTELASANREFSDRFVTVNLTERLGLFTRARIFSKRGDCYSFSYPYVYYFFVGRYLAKHLEQPEIQAWVEESCKKLYVRDRANAIMFLTHHVENKWLIQLISQVLRECFAEKAPLELNGDTSFLNELVEKASQLTLSAPNVDKNQSEIREYSDAMVEQEPDDECVEFDLLSFSAKWNLLHKTAEILGLILKNYYGSLERAQKQEMIREVFDGPLRALRIWLDEIAENLSTFVAELKLEELSHDPKLTPEEAERKVKRKVFNLMGWVATSVVASSANFVAAEKLREDVAQVVKNSPTNAYRLIEAASRLLKPGAVSIDHVKGLARDLEKNPYAFGVLQSLGFFHMSMFHTEEPQKQALSSALKISFHAVKAIEVRKRGRLLK